MPTPPRRSDDIDTRVTRLETALPYIKEDLTEARDDIKAIKRSAVATLWSILFVMLLAIFGTIFRKLGVL